MRTYAYLRIDPHNTKDPNIYLNFFNDQGYHVQKNRILLEEVTVDTPVAHRDRIINLINYGIEENDLLIIKGLDSLGSCFADIFELFRIISEKKIRLVCLDYSKNEIKGDLKKIFIHFLKLSIDFERKYKNYKKNNHKETTVRKVGRPEILNSEEKEEVLQKFKKGHSVYSLAKEYSVTRPVIQRILNKASKKFNRI